MMGRSNSSGISPGKAPRACTTSALISASTAPRTFGWAKSWERVMSGASPRNVHKALAVGHTFTRRWSNSRVTWQVDAGRPISSDIARRSWVMYLPPSIRRASLRSSCAVRRLTRPISRRYMRTGSSIMSPGSSSVSASFSASFSISLGDGSCPQSPSTAIFRPPASTATPDWLRIPELASSVSTDLASETEFGTRPLSPPEGTPPERPSAPSGRPRPFSIYPLTSRSLRTLVAKISRSRSVLPLNPWSTSSSSGCPCTCASRAPSWAVSSRSLRSSMRRRQCERA